MREGDGVVLTTYGRSSGFCVDPIEKKPLNHFLPGSSVLSFGTAGCNLACRFCQNWDISKSKEIDTLADAASPEAIATRGGVARRPQRRVHLQRPGDLHGVRHGRRRRVPRARHRRGRRHRRLHVPRAAPRVLRAPRRGERRPEGVHRGLLRPHVRRAPRGRARHPRVPRARDERVGRDHDPADPRPQRLRRRARRDDPLGRRAPRPRRPDALHRLPPRLQDARPGPDAAVDARAGARDRPRQRRPPRLHRQRPRPRRWQHLLLDLRHARDRARLVRHRRLPRHRRRPLRQLRRRRTRPVRRTRRIVGRTAPAGAARGLRERARIGGLR